MSYPVKMLTTAATKQGLRFLMIGGHAVNAYAPPRATLDVDLLIRATDRDLWQKLAEAEGYCLLNDGTSFLQFSPPYGVPFRLDFMLVNDPTFSALSTDSTGAACLGVTVQVPSPLNLIALKLHAIRYGPGLRKDKDWLDILNIIRAIELDPKDAALKSAFDRHGTAGLYAELLERCSRG